MPSVADYSPQLVVSTYLVGPDHRSLALLAVIAASLAFLAASFSAALSVQAAHRLETSVVRARPAIVAGGSR